MSMFVGAYWGPREEDIEGCAARVMDFFRRLSSISPFWARWYNIRRTRRNASKSSMNLASKKVIIELLDQGRNRGDTDNSIIEDLGFRVGLWNGEKKDRDASVNVHCGAYHPHSGNSVLIYLPRGVPELIAPEPCAALLEAVVRSFEPEWGVVSSGATRSALQKKVGVPFVDWIFYHNQCDLDASKLPTSASYKIIDTLGTIVVVQDRPIDPTNQQDLANVRMVAAALNVGQSTA